MADHEWPPTVRPATASDAVAVRTLVSKCRLPVAGLESLEGVLGISTPGVVAVADGHVVGCAIVEPYGRAGLLRSVAVDAAWRGRRVGEALVGSAVVLAGASGLNDLVLLTETAAPFFARLGFDPIPREDVPEPVRASGEFVSVCPASAQAMRRPVVPGPEAAADPMGAPGSSGPGRT